MGLDFFFMGEKGTEGTVPAVAMRDSISKALFAHVIPGKGFEHDWVANQLASQEDKIRWHQKAISFLGVL